MGKSPADKLATAGRANRRLRDENRRLRAAAEAHAEHMEHAQAALLGQDEGVRLWLADREAEAAAIRERFEAAERLCVVFGWCASRRESERDLAANALWRRWVRLVPEGFTEVKAHPDLTDGHLTELARRA